MASLTLEVATERLVQDGWTVLTTSSGSEAGSHYMSCEARAGDVSAMIDSWVETGAPAVPQTEHRTTDGGTATVTQPGAELAVEVADGAAAEVLIEGLVASL